MSQRIRFLNQPSDVMQTQNTIFIQPGTSTILNVWFNIQGNTEAKYANQTIMLADLNITNPLHSSTLVLTKTSSLQVKHYYSGFLQR